jgi:uncharacterized protein YjiS (DUF1127 family)
MAELVMPFARRSSAAGAAHFIAGAAGAAVARFRKARAERRTIAQLRALDDRTLHDIGLHRSEIASLALDVGANRIRRRYY